MTSMKLYPQVGDEGPSSFRLTHMSEGIKFLEEQVANYTRCKRKYNFCYNTLYYMTTGSVTVSAGCSVSGLVLLASGPGAIVSLPLMGVGLASELFAAGLGIINKKILLKLKKHGAISALASAKLNSLKLIFSKSIEDGKISDEEFSRFQQDIEDYKSQKNIIQKSTLKKQTIEDVEKLKQRFLEEMKGTFEKLTETANKSPSR